MTDSLKHLYPGGEWRRGDSNILEPVPLAQQCVWKSRSFPQTITAHPSSHSPWLRFGGPIPHHVPQGFGLNEVWVGIHFLCHLYPLASPQPPHSSTRIFLLVSSPDTLNYFFNKDWSPFMPYNLQQPVHQAQTSLCAVRAHPCPCSPSFQLAALTEAVNN